MDPDANLNEQLELAQSLVDIEEAEDLELPDLLADIARLSELVIALDGWIRSGGFLPSAWKRP